MRFAPLCRVSTESQEQQGASLQNQKDQITQYVQKLQGDFIDDPWRYSGQEHATADFERKRFDQLIEDSSKGIFDAVIVTTPDRFSRDILKSALALVKLLENGIKFLCRYNGGRSPQSGPGT
jgi:DNA invertase Pin-like site-specific DNA recombinase